MEGQLKFFTVLSLKEIALRRVVAELWSDPDVLASVSESDVGEIDTEERKRVWLGSIEYKVKNKVSKLEIPESLKKQMVEVVRPIGLEIKRWKHYHEGYLSDKEKILLPDSVKLFWTSAGTIDYRKTAEDLVRCDALDIVHRYRLACLNCLEDDISLLWEKLAEESKYAILHPKKRSSRLTRFWPHIMKGEVSELDRLLRKFRRNGESFNQGVFYMSALTGNKVATRFFFQKSKSEDREISLMRTFAALLENRFRIQYKYLLSFRNENFSDVLCYLLTLLTPEQQLEIMKAYPVRVFLSFLHCPCQDLFFENAGLLWSFVPESSYLKLIIKMSSRYKKPRLYFPRLLREFFKQSPPNFLKTCLDRVIHGAIPVCNFLSLFFHSEDTESLKVMFRSMDAADRVKLVFFPDSLLLFFNSIVEMRWRLVEVCFRKAMLSGEDKKRMKGIFEILAYREGDKQKFKRCFEFLDGTDEVAQKQKKAQKRKLENCSPE